MHVLFMKFERQKIIQNSVKYILSVKIGLFHYTTVLITVQTRKVPKSRAKQLSIFRVVLNGYFEHIFYFEQVF